MAKTKSKPTDVFVRGLMDLGDFNDDEKDFGPSMTDPSQDEPIEALVARMMRGEVMAHSQASYDVPPGTSVAEAFSAQPIVERDDFDISDSGQILAAGLAASKTVQAPSPAPGVAPVAPAPAPAAAPVDLPPPK